MSKPVYVVLRKKYNAAYFGKGEFCAVFGDREDAYKTRDVWNQREKAGYVYFIVTTPIL